MLKRKSRESFQNSKEFLKIQNFYCSAIKEHNQGQSKKQNTALPCQPPTPFHILKPKDVTSWSNKHYMGPLQLYGQKHIFLRSSEE